jgi:glyoxylase-like metal-dependent hydrolase (beta-lactamase superfamily II)
MTSLGNHLHKIRLGFCNAYLIQGEGGAVLVDAGPVNCERTFIRYVRKHTISLEAIKLIVITHVHFDHVGGLNKLKKRCRCPVAVHAGEASALSDGAVFFPPGTNLLGKMASLIGSTVGKAFMKYPPVKADIVVSEETSLIPFGVSGKIVPTPGHTANSLSVLLTSGEAFVGDLAANYLPANLGPIFPPFAENVELLLQSWEDLLKAGARIICPGHGRPFSAHLLRRKMRSLRKQSQAFRGNPC